MMTETQFTLDEEHTYSFICSRQSAEQFNCVHRLFEFKNPGSSSEMLYFCGPRVLYSHNPNDFLLAHGFDLKMMDDVDFEFIHHYVDRNDVKASYE